MPSAGQTTKSRLEIARETAQSLVDLLETGNAPIAQSLMMAQRLARLLRDADAERWLDLEMNGYPEQSDAINLGHCVKYALRFFPDGKVYRASLPELEILAISAEHQFKNMKAPTLDAPVNDHVVAAATQKVISGLTAQMASARTSWVNSTTNFSRMKSGVHQYAADALISLELGTVAESIFESARGIVDTFVRKNVPEAAEQLVAASERMLDGTAESRSAALTACRRLLATVADRLFPPRQEPFRDSSGKDRAVGAPEYKNRLMAFIDTKVKSDSTRSILTTELNHLAARLDALNDYASKGVHASVSTDEARLVLIQTYLFLAEMARVA